VKLFSKLNLSLKGQSLQCCSIILYIYPKLGDRTVWRTRRSHRLRRPPQRQRRTAGASYTACTRSLSRIPAVQIWAKASHGYLRFTWHGGENNLHYLCSGLTSDTGVCWLRKSSCCDHLNVLDISPAASILPVELSYRLPPRLLLMHFTVDGST
jgi:hypothetical protein